MGWIAELQTNLGGITVDDNLGPETYAALFAFMDQPGADPDELGHGAALSFPKYAIDKGPLRIAHWFAQFAHESSGFSKMEESLNYSAARLMQVWPNRFPTLASAAAYAANPQALAEKVYGGRLGNDMPGDGWKYRGRGPQITGKDNYRKAQLRTGLPLVDHPELAALPENFVLLACDYWDAAGCNKLADKDDLKAVTRAVNGGEIGLVERSKLLGRIERVLPT